MRSHNHTKSSRMFASLTALPGLLLIAPALLGQARNEYGEVQQTVARISYLDGSVSFARGDDPDNWQAADQNVPMTIGDRIYTGNRSRVELQVEGGDAIRMGAETDLAALNLTDETRQFSIKSGVASFQIGSLDDNEVFEVDTPNAAITADQPGDYRVDVDQSGNTIVGVRRGHVTVAAGGGQVPLQAGDQMNVQGTDAPQYDVIAMGRPDPWDQWVSQRQGRLTQARSLQYVSPDVVGADDLDQYGRWQQVPSYGWVWSPTNVAADWVPYRAGHWIWQDPWGWTWVSSEPWGWAPYHYGRWVVASSRWYWVPVARSVRVVAYAPALVGFVGGGPGWSASASVGGGGFVGWFPLGPRDPFAPWWGPRVSVNVTNATYVNRTYVTVVASNTFVSGGVVAGAVIRDQTVLRQVVAAPVARGPLPVFPTAASLRVAVRANLPAPPRPSAQILSRSVVARVAPPPAPPTFQAKLAVIRENKGAPVAAAAAAKMSIESRGRAQAIMQVRPVAAEAGKVTLAPRAGGSAIDTHRAVPITSTGLRGRVAATSQQPVSSAPVTTGKTVSGRSTARETINTQSNSQGQNGNPSSNGTGQPSNERQTFRRDRGTGSAVTPSAQTGQTGQTSNGGQNLSRDRGNRMGVTPRSETGQTTNQSRDRTGFQPQNVQPTPRPAGQNEPSNRVEHQDRMRQVTPQTGSQNEHVQSSQGGQPKSGNQRVEAKKGSKGKQRPTPHPEEKKKDQH